MWKEITGKIILALLLLQTIGCTKEDITDCPRFRLHFSYTHNSHGADLLATSIKDIRVYLFNETEILIDIIKVNEQQLKNGYVDVSIQPGRYSAVALAGSGKDLTQAGYRIVDMKKSSGYASLPLEIGRSEKDNFTHMLVCRSLPPETQGDVIPDAEPFDDLYYAAIEDITVINAKNQTASFSFIKNTNTLNITVTGLEYLSAYPRASGRNEGATLESTAPLSLFALAHNDIYDRNNAISIYSNQVRYPAQYKSLDATTMKVDIRTTLLDMDFHTVKPVYVHIQNSTTGGDMIPPLNIMETILKVEDVSGNTIYNSQQDIDKQDVYTIDISIASDLRVTVSLDSFVVEDLIPDITRP